MKAALITAIAALALAACSGGKLQAPASHQPAGAPSASAAGADVDAATRTSPVVPGRPGRVFVFAGLGDKCEQLPMPQITVDQAPQQGVLTYRSGQTTTIAASKTGQCVGKTAAGTGVYYTAREGASGTDTFALTAKLISGETMTRTFAVTIAP